MTDEQMGLIGRGFLHFKATATASKGSQKTPRRLRRWSSTALCMASAGCGCAASNATVIASHMDK